MEVRKTEVILGIQTGRQYYQRKNYDTALKIWKETLSQAHVLQYSAAMCVLSKNLGDVAKQLHQAKLALSYYEYALYVVNYSGIEDFPQIQFIIQYLRQEMVTSQNALKPKPSLPDEMKRMQIYYDIECTTCKNISSQLPIVLDEEDANYYCVACYIEFYGLTTDEEKELQPDVVHKDGACLVKVKGEKGGHFPNSPTAIGHVGCVVDPLYESTKASTVENDDEDADISLSDAAQCRSNVLELKESSKVGNFKYNRDFLLSLKDDCKTCPVDLNLEISSDILKHKKSLHSPGKGSKVVRAPQSKILEDQSLFPKNFSINTSHKLSASDMVSWAALDDNKGDFIHDLELVKNVTCKYS